eukprot:GILI01008733.1.p1 GENE.GILI01008733.1~~GILI01008733.1.p1  ORF type:complete len:550 (-),score=211.34 GILI01008733.1:223-1770(-)
MLAELDEPITSTSSTSSAAPTMNDSDFAEIMGGDDAPPTSSEVTVEPEPTAAPVSVAPEAAAVPAASDPSSADLDDAALKSSFVDLSLSRDTSEYEDKEAADASPSPVDVPAPAPVPVVPKEEDSEPLDVPFAEIAVSDPVKQGEGMNAFISYKITTRIVPPRHASDQQPRTFSVVRRFKDFEWLQAELTEKFPGVFVPPLPEKQLVVGRFSQEFIESRRRLLEKFLMRVSQHEDLRFSSDLKSFLEASDQQFEGFKQARKRSDSKGLMSMFSDLSAAVSNTITAKSIQNRPKSPADLFFEDFETYVNTLEQQLTALHKHTEKLVARLKDTASGLFEFGLSLTMLSQCEASSAPSLAQALTQVGGTADKLSVLCYEEVEKESLNFEEPVRDYLRVITGIKEALKSRNNAIVSMMQAESNAQTKRAKLTKLMQTAPPTSDKVQSAEREVEEAERRLGSAKLQLERLSITLTKEIRRFREEKEKDIKHLISDMVRMQVDHATKVQAAWAALVPALEE